MDEPVVEYPCAVKKTQAAIPGRLSSNLQTLFKETAYLGASTSEQGNQERNHLAP
jgi:hypothetical protein